LGGGDFRRRLRWKRELSFSSNGCNALHGQLNARQTPRSGRFALRAAELLQQALSSELPSSRVASRAATAIHLALAHPTFLTDAVATFGGTRTALDPARVVSPTRSHGP